MTTVLQVLSGVLFYGFFLYIIVAALFDRAKQKKEN